jgi:hypothetical protein
VFKEKASLTTVDLGFSNHTLDGRIDVIDFLFFDWGSNWYVTSHKNRS